MDTTMFVTLKSVEKYVYLSVQVDNYPYYIIPHAVDSSVSGTMIR